MRRAGNNYHNHFGGGGGGGKKGKNSIPEGWLGCPSMSTGFIDDRFFVFKTPLKPELNGKVPQADRFSMDKVFDKLHQMNNSTIGLWIDLTNTSRYYDAKDIVKRGIAYQKFMCEGHGRAPSNKVIFDFCGLVHQFFKRNQRDYIGVHCTHGFNRTGFLICAYLIRFRKYTAEEAVMEFAKYRQPGIYRQEYVNELYRMTRTGPPMRVQEPAWLQQRNQDSEQTSTSTSTSQTVSTLPGGSRSTTGVTNNANSDTHAPGSSNASYVDYALEEEEYMLSEMH